MIKIKTKNTSLFCTVSSSARQSRPGTSTFSTVCVIPRLFDTAQTCLTVEACDSLDFRASGDMWFSNADDMFACPDEGEALFEGGEDGIMSPVSVTYVGTFLKVLGM